MSDDNESYAVEDDVEMTDENILLYTMMAGPRVFVLNNSEMTNVLGLVLDETDDSFLVGIPGIIKNTMGGYNVEAFAPTPYMRLIKASVVSIMYLMPPVHQMYMDYVEKKGREIYPEIDEYLDSEEAEETAAVASEPITPETTDVSLTSEETEENKVQGMSDDELKKYLQEKFASGSLASGPKKKQ